MRAIRLAATALLGSCLGCAYLSSSVPQLGWMAASATTWLRRPSDECRYLSVLVEPSRNAAGMSERDAELAERVATLMKIEFNRLGTRVTTDPESAYFSLLVLAADDPLSGGFVFSAVLAARDLKEAHESGVNAYSAPDQLEVATIYHGLAWGLPDRLVASVREYVRQADAALLPLTQGLCEFERLDEQREDKVDGQIVERAPL